MGCPYCKSDESCEHHLLSVERGEFCACGGALTNCSMQGGNSPRAKVMKKMMTSMSRAICQVCCRGSGCSRRKCVRDQRWI